MCSSTKIYFDCIRQSERGVLLKGCNMKSRVCIRCSIMRASTNDDDVEATAVVEAATNSDTIATAVSPVLTAPAVTAVSAMMQNSIAMVAREKELLQKKQEKKARKQQKISETASVNMQVVEEVQPCEESKQNAAHY